LSIAIALLWFSFSSRTKRCIEPDQTLSPRVASGR